MGQCQAWGQHLILDLAGCPKDKLTDGEHIKRWTKELVSAIDMVAYGEPQLEHFATHDPKTGGYTLVQLIETSNICAHFAENRGEVYIDIFSCKSFDEAVAREVCERYFEPKDVTAHALMRGEPKLAAV
ncbi:MAG: S-adenosylmethionine decarboxylase [Vampirovibrionales bacterium]|nr:S-adenosylmethionine decarboxylase [Vampirovibrionales bacterium]